MFSMKQQLRKFQPIEKSPKLMYKQDYFGYLWSQSFNISFPQQFLLEYYNRFILKISQLQCRNVYRACSMYFSDQELAKALTFVSYPEKSPQFSYKSYINIKKIRKGSSQNIMAKTTRLKLQENFVEFVFNSWKHIKLNFLFRLEKFNLRGL